MALKAGAIFAGSYFGGRKLCNMSKRNAAMLAGGSTAAYFMYLTWHTFTE
jgi:hypothetical protein